MKMHLCAIVLTFGLSFVAQAKIGETRAEVEARLGGPGEIEDRPIVGKVAHYIFKDKDGKEKWSWFNYRLGKVVVQGVSLANEDELPSVAKDVTGFEDVRDSEDDAGILALSGFTVFDVGPDFRILYAENEGKPFAVFMKKKDLADLKLRTLTEIGKEFNKEAQ